MPPPSTIAPPAGGGRPRRAGRRCLTRARRSAGSRSSSGDEVAASDAVAEVVALAEALGAPVLRDPAARPGVFPPPHPLWAGMLTPAAAAMNAALAAYDRVLLDRRSRLHGLPVHARAGRCPRRPSCSTCRPIPISSGASTPTRWAAAGDPEGERSPPCFRSFGRGSTPAVAGGTRARPRRPSDAAAVQKLEDTALSALRRLTDGSDGRGARRCCGPCRPSSLVVDEAITTGRVRPRLPPRTGARALLLQPGRRSGLGHAGGASASRSAHDGEPVLCVVGDGSAHVLAAGAVDGRTRAASRSCSRS